DYASPFEAASALFGDALFACGSAVSGQLLAPRTAVYAYEFDDAAASDRGAMHSAEVRYFFNVDVGGSPIGPTTLPPPRQLLPSPMRLYWTQFARAGDPNGVGRADWPTLSSGQVQVLSAPIPTPRPFASYSLNHKCAFWI